MTSLKHEYTTPSSPFVDPISRDYGDGGGRSQNVGSGVVQLHSVELLLLLLLLGFGWWVWFRGAAAIENRHPQDHSRPQWFDLHFSFSAPPWLQCEYVNLFLFFFLKHFVKQVGVSCYFELVDSATWGFITGRGYWMGECRSWAW